MQTSVSALPVTLRISTSWIKQVHRFISDYVGMDGPSNGCLTALKPYELRRRKNRVVASKQANPLRARLYARHIPKRPSKNRRLWSIPVLVTVVLFAVKVSASVVSGLEPSQREYPW